MSMMDRSCVLSVIFAAVCLLASFGVVGRAQIATSASRPAQKETRMNTHARGEFTVKLTPQETGDKAVETPLGRMTIDKQFQGDLTATSQGEMLTAVTGTKGSAGYVAVERVSGTLQGRTGTFVLQHSGTMTRGTPHLVITVVPDSGTGQLGRLTGQMDIQITDGKHFYDFAYVLPDAPQ